MNHSATLNKMQDLLTQAFAPTLLEIQDESAAHIGHAGAQGGAGHFTLKIEAADLPKTQLLSSHRKIYAVVAELMPDKIHALKIEIL